MLRTRTIRPSATYLTSLSRHQPILPCVYVCLLLLAVQLPAGILDEPWNSLWPLRSSAISSFVGAQQLDSVARIKPSIILIAPQSFKVPINTSPIVDEGSPIEGSKDKLKQFVAVINNAQNEAEDEVLRQRYKKLSLQIRDARQPNTGQLFYEHIFDYFPPNQRGQHLLIPVNLDQVSPTYDQTVPVASQSIGSRRALAQKVSSASYASVVGGAGGSSSAESGQRATTVVTKPQLLVISIRPYQSDLGATDGGAVVFASSPPISVEPVASGDGLHSFSIVQTDKPIYKPEDKVRMRALVVNENLRPIVGDEFKLQIRNPHQIVVEEIRYPRAPEASAPVSQREPLFVDHTFEFPPEPMLGTWTVHLLHSDPVANDTTSFEVREYVLPPYEIAFNLPRYILPSTLAIAGSISAKYHYGKPVQGKVQIKFGYKESLISKPKYIARSGVKTVDPSTGQVEFRFDTSKFKEKEWFPSIAGSKLIVEATVTEASTGHQETAQDVSCTFVTAPYRFSFENSITDFKSDIVQQLSIQLVDSLSHQPGPAGEKITASYFDNKNGTALDAKTTAAENRPVNYRERFDTEAVTDHLGRAVFNIGPIREDLEQIQINFKLTKSRVDADQFGLVGGGGLRAPRVGHTNGSTLVELASARHTLSRHYSPDGWIHLMNKTVTHLNVGDEFVSDILIRDAASSIVRQKIFYTISARGQIVALNALAEDGLVRFQLTESMVPSLRLVLFLLSGHSTTLSDSMRIHVAQELGCGLALKYESKSVGGSDGNEHGGGGGARAHQLAAVKPNDAGKLIIQARPGDLVSLIGVDGGVYTLNNRTRLDSLRLIERIRRLDAGCGFGGGQNDLDVFHNAGLLMFAGNATSEQIGYIGSACLTMPAQLRHLDDVQLGYTRPIFSHNQLQLRAPQSHTRRKRDDEIEQLLLRYKDPVHRACCRLGTLEDSPSHRDCNARMKIVEKYAPHKPELKTCASTYMFCCQQVFGVALRLGGTILTSISERTLEKPRSRYVNNALQYAPQLERFEMETLVRKDFRETWLFELVQVDNRAGQAALDVQLPHTITTWTIDAMALNRNSHMCLMARPFKLTTYQEIFIDVSMPYKVVQGEQIDLVTKIFNYSPHMQDVLVYMYGVEDVCSEAEPGERSERKRVRIEQQASQSVLFPMIPLRTGKFPIKIIAIALSSNTSDIIERQLNVVPRGKPVTDETTFSLDPLNQQRRSKRAIQTGNLVDEIDSSRGLQHSKVRLTPSRDSEFIVPQTHECIVSAIGDKLGQTVQTTILDVENLIRLPHGCGEQVMIYLGPTLYTARYLSSINKLTGDTRWRAIRYVQSGYKRILNFRREDGGFSAFAHRDPSIWLTAFVVKLLCQTERTPFIADEVHVDRTVIDLALKWLIERQDNGTWIELHPVYHREMLGGTMKEKVLTAFVSVTLNECAHHAPDLIEEVPLKNDMAFNEQPEQAQHGPFGAPQQDRTFVSHRQQTNGIDTMRLAAKQAESTLLAMRLTAVKDRNPYVLALVAYAMSALNPQEAVRVLDELMLLAEKSHSRNQIFWRGDHQIETAAYALQAIIETAPYVVAREKSVLNGSSAGEQSKNNRSPGTNAIAVANWLSSRRSYTGAFDSTQDTVVALEALSKFAQLQSNPAAKSLLPQSATSSSTSLTCNVTVSNRTRRSIEFGEDNAQVLQTFKLGSFDFDSVNGEILDITTTGSGLGTMSVKLKYNVFQEEDDLCRFNIDSTIEEWQSPLSAQSRHREFEDSSIGQDKTSERNHMSGENYQNSTIEDDYFKTFDKSMLSELNLIDQQPSDNSQSAGPRDQDRPKFSTNQRTLRLKRSSSDDAAVVAAAAMTAASRVSPDDSNESWTSKMVSTLKSKLPSWIIPKRLGERDQPRSAASIADGDSIAEHHFLDTRGNRRNGTSRRSANQMGGGMPLIMQPTGMQTEMRLNNLSQQLEIASQNKSLNAATNSSLNTYTQISLDQLSRRLVLLLRICVHHMARRDSEMSVIEVGILSGFKPNEADLKEIINDPGTPAMKYELSPDRSLVIIYMHHIPNSGPYCLQFRLVRDSLVYNLQSGYIRVYEYYSPRHSCSNFYTPSRVTDLIRTKCDSTGQVCQCASKSLCPTTNKLAELGEIHQVNTTSARNQLIELFCSNRFDLISLVRLKSVKHLEAGNMFKLSVKVKADLKGNLTKIVEAQRQQESHLVDKVPKPQHNLPTAADMVSDQSSVVVVDDDAISESTSLELLSMSIDAGCIRDDPFLLHLAHPTQWKQGGELILFARSQKLERRLFKSTQKQQGQHLSHGLGAAGRSGPLLGPRPKPNVYSDNNEYLTPANRVPLDSSLRFEDAQQLQYSLQLQLDKDTILHDLTYQAKIGQREALNNLILWLELRSRRERGLCR